MRERLLSTPLVALLLCACTTEAVAPFGKEPTLQLHEDEKRLWLRSQEEEKQYQASGHLYDNPDLESYVNEVAQRLIPVEVSGKLPSIRIKIIKNPCMNAFAMAHGVIYIHTGVLARMENEAQLATLLAHEITHITHRHTIQGVRSRRSAADVLGTLGVIAAPAGIYGVAPLLLGAVGAMAAVTGYSRELEAEADMHGLELVIKAGYDPEEAPKLFKHIKRELEEEKIEEPFFFGTHPRLKEREDSYSRLLQNRHAGKKGDKGTERFTRMIHPLLLENARMDLSMGRFGLANETIDRFLLTEPQSAKAHYYLGEVYRQRAEQDDGEKAKKEYDVAIQLDPAYPEPHKGLAFIYSRQGLKEKAKVELEQYLSLAPNAEDKAYIEQYLQEIATR